MNWWQRVYKSNYDERWSNNFCWWFQNTLFDYEKQGFPYGDSLMGYNKWKKENNLYFDHENDKPTQEVKI